MKEENREALNALGFVSVIGAIGLGVGYLCGMEDFNGIAYTGGEIEAHSTYTKQEYVKKCNAIVGGELDELKGCVESGMAVYDEITGDVYNMTGKLTKLDAKYARKAGERAIGKGVAK